MPNSVEDTVIGVILSLNVVQTDQSHRASGNFTTNVPPGGECQKMRWEIRDARDAENKDPWDCPILPGVRVDIKEDKSAAADPTLWPGLENDALTPYGAFRSIYVANPSRADGKFWVVIYKES